MTPIDHDHDQAKAGIDHEAMRNRAKIAHTSSRDLGPSETWIAVYLDLTVRLEQAEAKYAALETAAREWKDAKDWTTGTMDLRLTSAETTLAALLDAPAVAPAQPSAVEVAAREWARLRLLSWHDDMGLSRKDFDNATKALLAAVEAAK